MKKKLFKNKKFLTLVLGLIIISIMVGSILDTGSTQDKYKYNNYEFIKVDNKWVTYKDKRAISLTYGPKELEDVRIDQISISSFDFIQKIYLSRTGGISNDFLQIPINKQLVTATYEEDISIKENIPLKTCQDANNEVMVFMFINSNETSVVFEGNCLTFKDKSDFTMAVDKLLLKLYGII